MKAVATQPVLEHLPVTTGAGRVAAKAKVTKGRVIAALAEVCRTYAHTPHKGPVVTFSSMSEDFARVLSPEGSKFLNALEHLLNADESHWEAAFCER